MNSLDRVQAKGLKKIFYAGFLKPFKHVGSHPQFNHIQNSPPGYEFVTSSRFGFNTLTKVLRSTIELFSSGRKNGANPSDIIRFIRSRGMMAQLSFPSDVSLAFLPSIPYILGQIPWVIEIEDTTTLYVPFVRIAGRRLDPRLFGTAGIYDSEFHPCIKALLESENCRGVVCHVRSTAESIPLLYDNPRLREKIFHVPLGVGTRPARPLSRQHETVTLLFTSSWHQGSTGFYLRGGLDVLEAFARLRPNHPNLRLVLRSKLPADLNQHYWKIIREGDVQVIDRFLSDSDIEDLYSNADIYLLPSARLHVVSILQGMAHGLTLLVSDGWGIEEYVEDGRNGVVVPGRYGKCSWMDPNGMLRENYRPLFAPDPNFVDRLEDRLARLVSCADLRQKLGETARKDALERFSLENWNTGLSKVFDQAIS